VWSSLSVALVSIVEVARVFITREKALETEAVDLRELQAEFLHHLDGMSAGVCRL
jgi:hypothetical protein